MFVTSFEKSAFKTTIMLATIVLILGFLTLLGGPWGLSLTVRHIILGVVLYVGIFAGDYVGDVILEALEPKEEKES